MNIFKDYDFENYKCNNILDILNIQGENLIKALGGKVNYKVKVTECDVCVETGNSIKWYSFMVFFKGDHRNLFRIRCDLSHKFHVTNIKIYSHINGLNNPELEVYISPSSTQMKTLLGELYKIVNSTEIQKVILQLIGNGNPCLDIDLDPKPTNSKPIDDVRDVKIGDIVYNKYVWGGQEPLTVIGLMENRIEFLVKTYKVNHPEEKKKQWLYVKTNTSGHNFSWLPTPESKTDEIQAGDYIKLKNIEVDRERDLFRILGSDHTISSCYNQDLLFDIHLQYVGRSRMCGDSVFKVIKIYNKPFAEYMEIANTFKLYRFNNCNNLYLLNTTRLEFEDGDIKFTKLDTIPHKVICL
jgi:hypothetical protein